MTEKNGNGKIMKQITGYATLIIFTVGITVGVIKFFSVDDVRASLGMLDSRLTIVENDDTSMKAQLTSISDIKSNINLICYALKIKCKD